MPARRPLAHPVCHLCEDGNWPPAESRPEEKKKFFFSITTKNRSETQPTDKTTLHHTCPLMDADQLSVTTTSFRDRLFEQKIPEKHDLEPMNPSPRITTSDESHFRSRSTTPQKTTSASPHVSACDERLNMLEVDRFPDHRPHRPQKQLDILFNNSRGDIIQILQRSPTPKTAETDCPGTEECCH